MTSNYLTSFSGNYSLLIHIYFNKLLFPSPLPSWKNERALNDRHAQRGQPPNHTYYTVFVWSEVIKITKQDIVLLVHVFRISPQCYYNWRLKYNIINTIQHLGGCVFESQPNPSSVHINHSREDWNACFRIM